MSLKFKVTGTRTVAGAEPGGTLDVSEKNARPGYVGTKKEGKPSLNIPALLLGGLVEPANAETRKWCASLEGSQFVEMFGEPEAAEGNRENG